MCHTVSLSGEPRGCDHEMNAEHPQGEKNVNTLRTPWKLLDNDAWRFKLCANERPAQQILATSSQLRFDQR